ncbi:MAG TPA: serine/threonine-protein kinase [Nocardioides sp.]|nr:serine/threonine-protein kinase [Nocardioides sp.]
MRRRIGSGAFATVWLAYDEHLDSPVAIKVLADNWTGDLHIRQRFVEEGRFLRKVESPHVVQVYDAGELPDERPYLVMAYADQGTLADRLELEGLEPSQALAVITQVGRGLTALHDRGVLHRDVKPANVLFRTVESARGAQVVAMVGDLGLGKAMDMSSRLTMVGGTPTYVAPEQALGEALDGRADQFSLAALGYCLLAGRQPFHHTTLAAAEDPLLPPPMGIGNPAAEAVVLKALSKDRADRFDDVESFTSALAEALGGQVEEAPLAWVPADPSRTQATARPADTDRLGSSAPPPAPARRRRLPWLVAGIVAVAGGFGIGWAAEQSSTSERTVEDATGTIEVTVPEAWTSQVDPEQWIPKDGQQEQPAIAMGSRPGWNTAADPAPGVFVGLLVGEKLPSRVPQHFACESNGELIKDEQDGDQSMTVFFSGCPGADVVAERVVQLTSNRLLWVQVASDDRGTANRVLASVTTYGF